MADSFADRDDPVARELGREKYSRYLQMIPDAAMESIFHAVSDRVAYRYPRKRCHRVWKRKDTGGITKMTLLQRIKNKVRARSIHVAYVDVGSCNGCDIEVLACLAPRYDIEQYGIFVHNNPREADILLVIGAYTPGWEEKLAMVWEKIPDPKAAVAIGNCPISGCVFDRRGSFVDPPVKKHIPIAAEVPGCPPRPTEILQAILSVRDSVFANWEENHP